MNWPFRGAERIEGVCLDLFDTLIVVDPDRLPKLRIDSRDYPSALPVLCREIGAMLPEVESERILVEMLVTLQQRPVRRNLREHSSRSVFTTLLTRLGVADADLARCASHLGDVQMQVISQAVRPRSAARLLLDTLKRDGIRTALVSNLDHARSAPWLLEAAGLKDCFAHLILSEDVGLRKPHRNVFHAALSALSLTPDRVVHIGDDEEADILGAGRLGIATVWVNPAGRPVRRHRFPPALIVSELDELLGYRVEAGRP